MKRFIAFLSVLFLLPALSALADPHDGKNDNNNKPSRSFTSPGTSRPAPARQNPAPAQRPVIINMTRPASGGHNTNFPSQQPKPQPAAARVQPSYGRLNWNAPAKVQPQPQAHPWAQTQTFNNGNTAQRRVFFQARPSNAQAYAPAGQKAAVVVHHHPYTPGYVRKKLQRIGVTQEPALITNRAEMIHTSKQYSTIRFPKIGPDRAALNATIVSPRHFNDPVVRDHMALVDSRDWRNRIAGFNSTEDRRNHYYWHQDNSFNYCHYIDDQGYNWWGWYAGDQFFWNRYYEGRWWWYDSDYDRWCFWNDGYWWWQDPYHVGDLYCYNDDNYIPCNSANDQEVVTAPADQNYQVYNAPDNSCQVKVMSGTQDAFLYDTDDPNAQQPVYLASGVEQVMFSDTNNGRPLEIVLKLNDGTFDMFDNDGNSYGPGNFDADQDAANNQGDVPADPPNDTNTDN